MKIVLIIAVIIIAVAGLWWMASKTENSSSINSDSNVDTNTTDALELTMDELAKHDKSNDCWLLIDGGIYDVTDYIKQHPGGSSSIIINCGKDSTNEFANKGGEGSHSVEAEAALNNYFLGELSGSF